MAETSRTEQQEPTAEGPQAVSAASPAWTEDEGPPPLETSREARNMAMLCHILGIAGFVAPLVIWLSERDKHRFVDEHGREAMNYQISLIVYYLVCAPLCFIVVGLVLLPVLTVAHVILAIAGAVRASRGKSWRYPIAIPFLRW